MQAACADGNAVTCVRRGANLAPLLRIREKMLMDGGLQCLALGELVCSMPTPPGAPHTCLSPPSIPGVGMMGRRAQQQGWEWCEARVLSELLAGICPRGCYPAQDRLRGAALPCQCHLGLGRLSELSKHPCTGLSRGNHPRKGSIKGATDAINASNVLQFLFSQTQSQTPGTPQELRKSIKPFLINRLFIIHPFSSAP